MTEKIWLKRKWPFVIADQKKAGAKKMRKVFPHISVLSKPPQLPHGAILFLVGFPGSPWNFLLESPRNPLGFGLDLDWNTCCGSLARSTLGEIVGFLVEQILAARPYGK